MVTYRIKVPRGEWATVLEYLIEALLDGRQLIRLVTVYRQHLDCKHHNGRTIGMSSSDTGSLDESNL